MIQQVCASNRTQGYYCLAKYKSYNNDVQAYLKCYKLLCLFSNALNLYASCNCVELSHQSLVPTFSFVWAERHSNNTLEIAHPFVTTSLGFKPNKQSTYLSTETCYNSLSINIARTKITFKSSYTTLIHGAVSPPFSWGQDIYILAEHTSVIKAQH